MNRFTLFIFLCLPLTVLAQPAEFGSVCPTAAQNLLTRFITINMTPAEPGIDWAAVIDSDGFTVGREPIELLTGFQGCPDAPAFSFVVYRENPPNTCPNGYGLSPGEVFRVTVWDASSGIFYELDEDFNTIGGFDQYPPPPQGNCQVQNVDAPSSLPVTYAALSAREIAGEVRIDWSTATETGNAYFEIEHSATLANFVPLGRVTGAGESNELRNYQYLHDKPLTGTNYYRIKQVDYDGSFSYSGVVVVDVASSAYDAEPRLFPNPSRGSFNLTVGSEWSTEAVNVTVTDAVGRQVLNWVQDTEAVRAVSTTDLAPGLYLLRVDDGQRSTTKRLVVN